MISLLRNTSKLSICCRVICLHIDLDIFTSVPIRIRYDRRQNFKTTRDIRRGKVVPSLYKYRGKYRVHVRACGRSLQLLHAFCSSRHQCFATFSARSVLFLVNLPKSSIDIWKLLFLNLCYRLRAHIEIIFSCHVMENQVSF